MKIAYLLSFFSLALVAGGCAANTADSSDDASDQSEGVSSQEAISTTITPGSFKIYDQPNHTPSGCDIMSKLDLTQFGGAKATLSDSVEGSPTGFSCHLAVQANLRTFRLHQTGESCGTKIYEGQHHISGGLSSIKITDNRARVCTNNVDAEIVVEETVPGFPGAITTTRYSAPVAPPAPTAITFEGTLEHTFGPGGENTGRSIESSTKTYELVLTTAQATSFVDGQLARVKGTSILLSGVETHNRPAIKVDDILVCPTPGSSFNCMPSSSGPALNECLPDNRSWIETKCSGVGYVD